MSVKRAGQDAAADGCFMAIMLPFAAAALIFWGVQKVGLPAWVGTAIAVPLGIVLFVRALLKTPSDIEEAEYRAYERQRAQRERHHARYDRDRSP